MQIHVRGSDGDRREQQAGAGKQGILRQERGSMRSHPSLAVHIRASYSISLASFSSSINGAHQAMTFFSQLHESST